MSIRLESHSAGGPLRFTLEGASEQNPRLELASGANVTITLVGTDSGVHNVCVAGRCSSFVTAPGETATLDFLPPAGGGEYYCQPHRDAGMVGVLSVDGVAPHVDEAKTPGLAAAFVVGLLVAVALVRRR